MENNLFKYIVYCTTCTVTKKIYIGVHQTINPTEFDGYLGCGCYVNKPNTYSKAKTKFQLAVKTYGPKNFIRNTIAVFDDENSAFLLEREIVNNEFLARDDVYNQVLGGQGGFTTSVPVFEYDEFGTFIQEYKSINSAAIYKQVDLRSIQRAISDKVKCTGHFWTITKFDKLDLSQMHQYEGAHKQPIFQYSSDGTYDCCYDSL